MLLATDEEVPDLETFVAKSVIFCIMAVTKRIKYMSLKKVMRPDVRMDAFLISAPTAVKWPHPKAVKYNFLLNDHFWKQ